MNLHKDAPVFFAQFKQICIARSDENSYGSSVCPIASGSLHWKQCTRFSIRELRCRTEIKNEMENSTCVIWYVNAERVMKYDGILRGSCLVPTDLTVRA